MNLSGLCLLLVTISTYFAMARGQCPVSTQTDCSGGFFDPCQNSKEKCDCKTEITIILDGRCVNCKCGQRFYRRLNPRESFECVNRFPDSTISIKDEWYFE